ncbi:MAG: hypothetical protein MI861_06125 [Pirellulales bacterium]|nr:hypothetical protein [Pirellulales bacterium]
MRRTIFLFGLVWLALGSDRLVAQQPEQTVSMKLTGAEVPALRTRYQLLPTVLQQRDGNAAVVMLRMIWEQQSYMQDIAPQIPGLLDLPYDDPKIPEILKFNHFYRQLRRAAYMRDADWYYPLNEEPHATILLPDVQGLRNFGARGLKLWVGTKIAEGDLDAAREGILVQLACARHLARTPIIVNQLVAATFADAAMDRMELLVQQHECPNFYWALSLLPPTLGDWSECLQFESNMLRDSLPALTDPEPGIGDPVWGKIAEQLTEVMSVRLSEAEAGALLVRMDAIARQDLVEQSVFAPADVEAMNYEEVIVRWVLHESDLINSEIEAAFSLPAPEAIEMLVEVEQKIEEIVKRTGAPATPFFAKPAGIFLGSRRFHRRAKMLQTAEAIRHHMAHLSGEFPLSLEDISDLHVPRDPITNKPFQYQLADGVATLTTPTISGVTEKQNAELYRQYLIAPADLEINR